MAGVPLYKHPLEQPARPQAWLFRMPKQPDPRTFEVTLTARQRDLLVIVRSQQPDCPSTSVSNDPAFALSAVIDAFDNAWDLDQA